MPLNQVEMVTLDELIDQAHSDRKFKELWSIQIILMPIDSVDGRSKRQRVRGVISRLCRNMIKNPLEGKR